MDIETGAPVAVLDATAITAMRTGATTAIGAKYLANPDSRVLGHIGSRGTAYWNVRLLCQVLPELEEIRIHSLRPETRGSSRKPSPRRPAALCGPSHAGRRPSAAPTSWSRPPGSNSREPLLRTEWIKPGALVVPYGTMSAVELSLTDIMDKVVVDDWGQAGAGPLGSLRAHVDTGRITREMLHAEIGEIVCGARPGREGPRRLCFSGTEV